MNPSFVNGIIVGAGIVLALMSVGFLYYIAPVENEAGISSTEIRVAIFLGGLVAAVAIAYEFYTKKNESKSENNLDETPKPEPELTNSENHESNTSVEKITEPKDTNESNQSKQDD